MRLPWPLPNPPGSLGLDSPINAILEAGFRLQPPDTDVEPYYPQQSSDSGSGLLPMAFLSHTYADEAAIRTNILRELNPYFGQVFFMNIGMTRPTPTGRDEIIQATSEKYLQPSITVPVSSFT